MKTTNLIFLLLVLNLTGSSVSSAQQAFSSEEIAQSLKPKSRTRGLVPAQMSPEDASFLENMKHKTRGLTVEERSQVSTIIEREGLSSIDLEINFAVDSAKLDPSSLDTLRKLGQALQNSELSNSSFLVAGHTDVSGTSEHNQALSDQRARTVKEFLVSNLNINPDRLLAVGYGREQLKNSNAPLSAENRRVKITNLGNSSN